MAKQKTIPCRVCGKLFAPCGVCQSKADIFCSKKCAEAYVKDALSYRASH